MIFLKKMKKILHTKNNFLKNQLLLLQLKTTMI